MSPTSRRKCNSICNWPYSFKYFKQPTVSRFHLGTTSEIQKTLSFPHSEVNMIPNTELSVHPMLIRIDFLFVLGYFQILPDLYNLLLHFLEQFWSKHNSVHWCPTPSSIQTFIRNHPQGCLLSIIVRKLYQVQVIFLLGWFVCHIHAKNIFKHLINSFCLPIYLRMVCSVEV